jgi:hypothetical protein
VPNVRNCGKYDLYCQSLRAVHELCDFSVCDNGKVYELCDNGKVYELLHDRETGDVSDVQVRVRA